MPEDKKLIAMIRKLAAESSLEVTPRGAEKVDSFADLMRLDISSEISLPKPRVFITFLPGSDLGDTTSTAIRLAREGIAPIPHIAARSLSNREMLDEALKSWTNDAGVEEVLLIGGAVPRPLGPFSCSLDVLRLGLLEHHGIRAVGFAGHPEGSPDIPPAICEQSLTAKERYALLNSIKGYIVTQFCFDSVPIFKYLRRPSSLPTHIGLPGLATLKTLIMHARQCGIGNSMRLLLKRTKDVTQLVATRAPDKLLREIALELSKNQAFAKRLGGIHLYPLGGVKKTAQWRKNTAEGKFQLQEDGFFTEA